MALASGLSVVPLGVNCLAVACGASGGVGCKRGGSDAVDPWLAATLQACASGEEVAGTSSTVQAVNGAAAARFCEGKSAQHATATSEQTRMSSVAVYHMLPLR